MLKHTFRVALITLFTASMMTACDGGGDKKTEDKKADAKGDEKADAKGDKKADAKGDKKADAKGDKGPEAVVPTDPSKAGGAPVPVM